MRYSFSEAIKFFAPWVYARNFFAKRQRTSRTHLDNLSPYLLRDIGMTSDDSRRARENARPRHDHWH